MNIIPLIPNANVNIVEKTKPIIVPFGPPCCGKLLLTHRLFKYLFCNGLYVDMDSVFLPPHLFQQYKIVENNFLNFLWNNTNHCRPMIPLMFRVIHNGNILCHLLYQKGESYYDPYNIESPIKLLEIIYTPNKKIWLFLLEINWGSINDRDNYVNRIIELSHSFGKTDEVIFVVPKIDQHLILYNKYGRVDLNILWRQVNNQYYRLFKHFKTKNFFWRFLKPYTFDFCPFSSGYFSRGIDNREVFVSGEDIFPEYLWKLIKKRL